MALGILIAQLYERGTEPVIEQQVTEQDCSGKRRPRSDWPTASQGCENLVFNTAAGLSMKIAIQNLVARSQRYHLHANSVTSWKSETTGEHQAGSIIARAPVP